MLQGSKSSKSLQHVKLLLPGVELVFPVNQREKHTSTSSWSFFPAIWKWMFWKTTLSLTHHSLEVSQGFRETEQQERADAKPLVLKSSCSAESPGKFFKTVWMPGFDTMALVFLKAAKLEDHCNKVYEFHIKALDKLRLKETLPHLSWKMNSPPLPQKEETVLPTAFLIIILWSRPPINPLRLLISLLGPSSEALCQKLYI